MRKSIWFNPEADYIGATGVNSVEDLAELVLADGSEHIVDLFDFDPDVELTVSDVAKVLDFYGVRPEIVPVSYLRREQWDSAQTFPCEIDARPGRGYVKVLGVGL